MDGLEGKVVIITGSNSGIGEGIAYIFASRGSRLSLVGRNKDRLESVVSNCISRGLPKENIIAMTGDLTDPAVRKTLVDNTVAAFGGIDILVNNAGVSSLGVCSDTSESEYRRVIETNQNVPFFLTQLCIPHLKERKGNIVNISSVAAHRSTLGITAYSMSKAALNMFTQCLALELAPYGVRANIVSPASVRTNISRTKDGENPDPDMQDAVMAEEAKRHPLGRIGESSDVAEAVAFLASNKASWVTGENFMVDGGRQCTCSDLVAGDKYKNPV